MILLHNIDVLFVCDCIVDTELLAVAGFVVSQSESLAHALRIIEHNPVKIVVYYANDYNASCLSGWDDIAVYFPHVIRVQAAPAVFAEQLIDAVNTGCVHYCLTRQPIEPSFVSFIQRITSPRPSMSSNVLAADNTSCVKQLEERVVALTGELQKSRNKAKVSFQAWQKFSSFASHELKNPLSALRGFAQLLRESESVPAEHKDKINTIFNNSERIHSIIVDVLDLWRMRPENIKLQDDIISPSSLVSSVCEEFRYPANMKKITFHVDNSIGNGVQIHADERMVKKIICNLLSNAISFTHEGGVTVRARYDEDTCFFFMEIRDTGVGIPQEILDNIFEPFYNYEHAFTEAYGLGLGLHISNKLVAAMRGKFLIESFPGIGTRVDVQLPLARVPDLFLNNSSQCYGDYVGPRLRVLVVESNVTRRGTISSFLLSKGFVVDTADTAISGIEKTLVKKPHLLVLSCASPDLDSLDMLASLSSIVSSAKVLLLSINGEGEKPHFPKIDCLTCQLPVDVELFLCHVSELLDLKWTAGRPSRKEIQQPSLMIFPPQNVVCEIDKLAADGKFSELSKLVSSLENDKQHEAFCNHIKVLIKTYDTDAICSFIHDHET